MSPPAGKSFFARFVPFEVYPLLAIIGFAVVGGGWFLTKLLRNNDVIIDRKNNPYPWLRTKPDEQIKLMRIHQVYGEDKSK